MEDPQQTMKRHRAAKCHQRDDQEFGIGVSGGKTTGI
jgi:hypothetical protein